MRIFRHYDEIPSAFRSSVVALGNFDGVHRGHRAVIAQAMLRAAQDGVPVGVMTFEPHPRRVFQPHLPPFTLTPFRTKARYMEVLDIDFLYVQHFDMEFAAKTAAEFVGEVLVDGLGVSHVVVGADYHFGHKRGGTVDYLNQRSLALGYGVTSVEAVRDESGEILSSTRVRDALTAGNPQEATRVLGRPWEVEGRVEQGDQRGRTIGFPTANVALGDYLRPAAGVYAVRAGVDQGLDTQWRDGVANFGRRPTFNKTDELLEVHLFDFDGDLYGEHLRVQMIDFLRPERRFTGLDALKAQIITDAEDARRLLAGRSIP
ncbi:MAG: riboflavin kinase [Rhodospirillaceae bacterium BRH_c57]|nr:MAG: riboflavin kinase [Rhodospirillaceae bacterium BRH_c57]